jgi:hypothetical protein
VISPVFDQGRLILPSGALVSGNVELIDKLGLGLRHSVARVDLHFTQLRLLDGTITPIDARVASVETARETVSADGAILGINPTANFSTGVSIAFTLAVLDESQLRAPILIFKFLAARSPDAEIFFPAGTEMILRVARNTEIPSSPRQRFDAPLLSVAQVNEILTGVPFQQAGRGRNQPSDLVNIMIVGSRGQVNRAFRAAGWTPPESHGILSFYHMLHCVVERKSYSQLPMSNLKLNGYAPDAAYEKSLDTFAKRHHIRLWHDDQSAVWLAAATEDVGYKMTKTHLTHATDRNIDNERAKVVNDLAFTGCVDSGSLVSRTFSKQLETHGSIATDGDIAVLQLNSCISPRVMPTDAARAVPLRAVRAAVAVGEDLARSNPVSVGFSLAQAALEHRNFRNSLRLRGTPTYARPSVIGGVPGGSLADRFSPDFDLSSRGR